MIAATLLACAEEEEPAPDPGDPFADCPPLAWVVQLEGRVTNEVHTVSLLPDGDVIVGGTYGGAPRIGLGLGQRLRQSGNGRDGFVARLAPDGNARWWRTIGSYSYDEMPSLSVVGESIWVMASSTLGGDSAASRVGVTVDGVAVTDTPSAEAGAIRYALELDLEGEVQRVRVAEVVDGAGASIYGGATADPSGNVYLSGDIGPVTLRVGAYEVNPRDTGSFLASWDPSGRPRWLTLVDAPETVSQPRNGLTWAEGKLQWAIEVRSDTGIAQVRTSDGRVAPLDLGPEMRGAVLSVDATTGAVLPLRYRVETNWIKRIDTTDGGAGTVYGNLNTVARGWWDADGVRHEAPGYSGFAATVDADGALTDLWLPEPSLSSVTAYQRAADGRAAVGGLPGRDPVGVGTARTYTVPHPGVDVGRDSVALTTEPDGTLECLAWWVGVGTADVVDVTPLPGGGMVVVGKFEGEATIGTPAGDQATLASEGYEDGFIAWFAEP